MKLITATITHIDKIMSWLTTKEQVALWGGPNFEFPFTTATFIRDCKLEELASFSLINEQGNVLAFGQYYQRLNRCHLGRLIVNPAYRGQGLGKVLIKALANTGRGALALDEVSLFVLADNQSAIALYQTLGFEFKTYPEEIDLANCLYMVKPDSSAQ